jgi:hypothetical protein
MDDHSENIVPRAPWQLPVSQTGDLIVPWMLRHLGWRLSEEGERWGMGQTSGCDLPSISKHGALHYNSFAD